MVSIANPANQFRGGPMKRPTNTGLFGLGSSQPQMFSGPPVLQPPTGGGRVAVNPPPHPFRPPTPQPGPMGPQWAEPMRVAPPVSAPVPTPTAQPMAQQLATALSAPPPQVAGPQDVPPSIAQAPPTPGPFDALTRNAYAGMSQATAGMGPGMVRTMVNGQPLTETATQFNARVGRPDDYWMDVRGEDGLTPRQRQAR